MGVLLKYAFWWCFHIGTTAVSWQELDVQIYSYMHFKLYMDFQNQPLIAHASNLPPSWSQATHPWLLSCPNLILLSVGPLHSLLAPLLFCLQQWASWNPLASLGRHEFYHGLSVEVGFLHFLFLLLCVTPLMCSDFLPHL